MLETGFADSLQSNLARRTFPCVSPVTFMSIYLRKISFYFAVAGIIGLVMIVRSLSQVKPMPDPPIAPVTKPAESAIAASGLVESKNENTNIGVPVPGLITELKVQVADKVKKDAVLMQLDDRDLRAQMISQEAQVNVATASLKRLEDQLFRLKGVSKTGAVTQDEISTRENDVEVGRAQLASARAVVQQTKQLMDRLTIRAPIDGTILQINTRVGEYISLSGKEPPIVMGQIDELQVRADVDEQLAPKVSPKMRAEAWVKGNPLDKIELKLVRIEPFIVPKVSLTGSSSERVDTRVLQVIFSMVPKENQRIYVGQQMDIYLVNTTAPQAVPK